MKFFSAIFLCFLAFHLQAQIENEDSLDLVENKPWLNFLQFPDSNAQAHLFMANWQYTYAPWGKMMQTGGRKRWADGPLFGPRDEEGAGLSSQRQEKRGACVRHLLCICSVVLIYLDLR